MSKYGRGGRQWQAARDELKARGDAYCWRGCGTWLLADAPRWHRQFMTIGHYLALEDGGDPYDPSNYGPECKPCNFSDGARRTNQKLGNPHRRRAGEYAAPEHPVVDPEWYEAYQIGKPMALLPIPAPPKSRAKKLTHEQVTEIRALRASKARVVDVAAQFGISIGMVSHITSNNVWRIA